MKTIKPNYETGLLNFMASTLSHFGVKTPYPTHPTVDAFLKEKDNVIVILIDAMGSKLIERFLDKDCFLRKHMVEEMTTVFPSTTAAATTIFSTGLAPISSGWMGWNEYFKEINDYRILFFNQGYYSGIKYLDDFVEKTLASRQRFENLLTEKNVPFYEVMPAFRPNGAKTVDEMAEKVIDIANNNEGIYLYAYWDKFDALMHEVGVDTKEAKESLEHINKVLEEMCYQLKSNNAVMIIADHGQLDTYTENLCLNDELCETFLRRPALEQRTMVFYIKEDCKEDFERIFKRDYGKYFNLYTAEEYVKELMGPFERFPRAMEFLGDYVAVSIDRVCMKYGSQDMIGQHAGLTEDEMMIPLILYRGVKE